MEHWTKLRWTLIAAIVVAVVGWFAWREISSGLPVDAVGVERGSLVVTVDHEGKTRVRDRFVVSAPLPGHVLRIELEPGDPVRAESTVLARFQPVDPTPLDVRSRAQATARIKSARAGLERSRADQGKAEATLELANSEMRRIVELFGKGIASRQQLDLVEAEERTAEQSVRAARASAQAARFELELARAALVAVDRPTSAAAGLPVFELTSPVDGIVLRRMRESEGVVAAGELLLVVADLSKLEIVADFLSSDAVRIHPGMAAKIGRWGGESELDGQVRRVNPSGFTKISALGVEEQRVNVVIDLVNPGSAAGLGDDFRVEARVVVAERKDALKIPAGSLFRSAGDWAVYAVESGKARLRKVEIGLQGELEVEVLDGLNEGDSVIVHPTETIEDGKRVSLRAEDPH